MYFCFKKKKDHSPLTHWSHLSTKKDICGAVVTSHILAGAPNSVCEVESLIQPKGLLRGTHYIAGGMSETVTSIGFGGSFRLIQEGLKASHSTWESQEAGWLTTLHGGPAGPFKQKPMSIWSSIRNNQYLLHEQLLPHPDPMAIIANQSMHPFPAVKTALPRAKPN